MNEDRRKELLKAMEDSKGACATLWQYSASLSELTIRIEHPGTHGNLHLACNGCQRIEASSSWNKVDLEFEELGNGFYALEDKSNDFRVVCRMVRVLQNVEPIYTINK